MSAKKILKVNKTGLQVLTHQFANFICMLLLSFLLYYHRITKMNEHFSQDGLQTLCELLRLMLRYQSISIYHAPELALDFQIMRFWDRVRNQIHRSPQEIAIKCVVMPLVENGWSLSGMYPLHAALCLRRDHLRVPYDILIQLVQACPEALYAQTELGLTTLHLAVNLDDFEMTSYVLDLHPGAIRDQSKMGFLPLHFARSERITRLLLEQYPSGACITDVNGNLPLHIACSHGIFSPKVVKMLLEKGMQYKLDGPYGAGGSFCANSLAHIPLKILIVATGQALSEGKSSNDIEVCWQKLSTCLWIVSESRRYHSGSLIHICLGVICDKTLLNFAMDKCKLDVFKIDASGRFPLHIAAMNRNVPGEIIQKLTVMNPTAAISADVDLKLPIHYASMNGRRYHDGVKHLVNISAVSLRVAGRDCKLFPFMMAAVGDDSSIDTIYELLRIDPNLIFPV